MNCAQSLELLSEFYADALDSQIKVQVWAHVLECSPCANVLHDMTLIIVEASVLRIEQNIPFPDEEVVWQRVRSASF